MPGNKRLVVERRLESTDKIADMLKVKKVFTPYSSLVPRPGCLSAWEQGASCGEKVRVH